MARPRKHSRLITVDGRQYRWHVDTDDDFPTERSVSVLPAEAPNGARLSMRFTTPTVSPSLVRRLILAGLKMGYDPGDPTASLTVPATQMSEILHDYPRAIVHDGITYTWTPESSGGLHVKVRRSDTPGGQLLATFTSLEPEHLREEFITEVIDAALADGWQPNMEGLDCHWLDEITCRRIITRIENE